jgi:hypothetical protein
LIRTADLADRGFWPGAHSDQRRPLRTDSGEMKLLSAVLAAAVTDFLVWSRRLQNPRNGQDVFWLRAQLHEVEAWLFDDADGYGLKLAAEVLNFDLESFRDRLKAERERRAASKIEAPAVRKPRRERSTRADIRLKLRSIPSHPCSTLINASQHDSWHRRSL